MFDVLFLFLDLTRCASSIFHFLRILLLNMITDDAENGMIFARGRIQLTRKVDIICFKSDSDV